MIDYQIQQDALGNDLWRTRVSRPKYNQLYPPDKGKPKTLMEAATRRRTAPRTIPKCSTCCNRTIRGWRRFARPLRSRQKSLDDGRRRPEPESDAASLVNFLKAALPAIAPPETKLFMAKVDFDRRISVDHPAATELPLPRQRKAQ